MFSDHNYSQSSVPKDKRISVYSLIFVMIGFALFSATMWSGGIIGMKLKFWDLIIALVVGGIFLCIYASTIGSIGVRTGLNTNILFRLIFGRYGSKLPSFLLACTQTGWFSVGVAMLALALHKLEFFKEMDIRLVIIMVGMVVSSNLFFGIQGLTVISMMAVPGIIILGVYSLHRAIGEIGGFTHIIHHVPVEQMSLFSAISVVIGSFISGGTSSSDFLRYGKKVSATVITCIISFFIGTSLMFLFGAFGAISTGSSDISDVMIQQGLIIPGIIVLAMNIWTTNDNCLYLVGLAMANVTGFPSKMCSLFSAVIGTISALWMYNNFVHFLTILSSIVPPIGGVILADYLLNKEKYYKYGKGQKTYALVPFFDLVNPLPFCAVLLGILGGYIIPGINSVNAVFTGFFTYIGLNLLLVYILGKIRIASLGKSLK